MVRTPSQGPRCSFLAGPILLSLLLYYNFLGEGSTAFLISRFDNPIFGSLKPVEVEEVGLVYL